MKDIFSDKDPNENSFLSQFESLNKFIFKFNVRYQKFLDDIMPYILYRWIFAISLLLLYTYRVWMEGWWIVTFTLALYLLTLAVGFVSPLETDNEPGSELPLNNIDDGEFKPFIRQVPEFKFWFLFSRACILSILCTFISFLNIPLFSPLLIAYYSGLVIYNIKDRVQHMIKHRYVPVIVGKPTYT